MGYSNLVDRQVALAFNKVKDLAVVATLRKATDVKFDFNAGEVRASGPGDKAVKVVVVDEKKPNKGSNTLVRSLMAKASDLGELNGSDVFVMDGYEWSVGGVLHRTGRVWLFEVYRET